MNSIRRPYHHGDLERATIDAAVTEIAEVGLAAVSMRNIARRAGVTHAALAYRFGDKAGVLTAVATEGFRLATAMIAPNAEGPNGFLTGGQVYVQFALTHPGHFEVMFRPDLYRLDNPELIAARDAAFDVLYRSATTGVIALRGDVTPVELTAVVLAGWSLSHGFATLALTGNLIDRLGSGPDEIAERLTRGVALLGELAARYAS